MKNEVLIGNAGKNWAASSTDEVLGGVVVVTAPTRRKVIEEFRSAFRFHLDGLRENGQDVPIISELEVREFVAA